MADRQKGRYTNGSGKTCQNCARAKIRCIRSEAAGSCDRWVNWRDRRSSMSDWLIDAAAWGNPVTFGRVEIDAGSQSRSAPSPIRDANSGTILFPHASLTLRMTDD
ncbi:hypothetical protein N7449_005585 [Penicillium cf. viridicatum]|uniref:Uncharacterized protein n=1 Tax=Penicillium cf. viridicatum TaxID=2972119 RepID=A0A9W9MLE7_9EURO|nr:hypothetical protein N7449_005585 [Penicillium cf. viridicatum]